MIISMITHICTLIFPASFIAAMSFTWSFTCAPPSVEITTSTCLTDLRRLSLSLRSPYKEPKIDIFDQKKKKRYISMLEYLKQLCKYILKK
jgi:hypothetical protein